MPPSSSSREWDRACRLHAIGYLVLAFACFAPQLVRWRRAIRWLLILSTALTFALWFVLKKHHDAEGYLDQVFEVALSILLLIDDRRAPSELSSMERC